jgi:hypothetical protein
MWNELRTKEVNGGSIFDGDDVLFIRLNNELDTWNYAESIGKLLFWCWLHHGSWPRWLHQMHMTFMFEGVESISCLEILKEYIPLLHKMALDIKISPLLQISNVYEWIDNRGLNVCNRYHYNEVFYCFIKLTIYFFLKKNTERFHISYE